MLSSLFYPFRCYWGVSSVFWTSLWACHSCSSSASFLRFPLPNFSFLSFYPPLVCSPPPAFLGFSGFASFLWIAFLQFRLWLHFSLPFGLSFSACCGLYGSLCSFSEFFYTSCGYGCLFPFFRVFPPAAVLAVPSCFSPSFRSGVFLSVLWTSSWVFSFLRLRLLFTFDAPLVVFHAAGSPLAVPQLFGCCLPCISAGFLLVGFSLPASCFFLVPRAEFSPLVSIPPSVCCGVLRSGFGSFSAGSALLCCCGFCLSVFLTRSNLQFSWRRGLPLG